MPALFNYRPGAGKPLAAQRGRGNRVSAVAQPSGGGCNPVRPLRRSGGLDAGRVPFVGEGCPETQPPRDQLTVLTGTGR